MDAMLAVPFELSEQIEATSWFRQNYAGVGPLTGQRVHMGRADAQSADPAGVVPLPGASAEEYIAWFRRMRLSLPALVNLAPYVDETCEATLRAHPECVPLFEEIDRKSYAPGYREKPLIKSFREMTLRGPAESADATGQCDRTPSPVRRSPPSGDQRRVAKRGSSSSRVHGRAPVWIM